MQNKGRKAFSYRCLPFTQQLRVRHVLRLQPQYLAHSYYLRVIQGVTKRTYTMVAVKHKSESIAAWMSLMNQYQWLVVYAPSLPMSEISRAHSK